MCPNCGQLNHFERTASTTVPSAIKMDEFLGTDIDSKPKKAKKPKSVASKHAKQTKTKSKAKKTTLSDLTPKPVNTAGSEKEFVDLTAPPETIPTEQKHEISTKTVETPSKAEPKSVRTIMKRLLVPELPAPHFSAVPTEAHSSSIAMVADSPSKVSEPSPAPHINSMDTAITASTVAATTNSLAPTSTLDQAELEHGQMIQAELEDTPTTTAIHVVVIILASVLLIAAGVLVYLVAR